MSESHVQSLYTTPLGPVRLLAGPRGLAGLWFEDQKHRPSELDGPSWPRQDDHALLAEACRQLSEYFSGRRQRFDLPLDLSAGTAFEQGVWHALLDIAHGQHRSYSEIGERIGRPSAARAVGAAVGRNRLSIIVPCHRVLGRDGRLTGYAGGLDRKRDLLQLEGVI
ncbi:MAG: methylated-DNA--[protein]-cysteine S-methyltransferase [Betaproteobacteria bacterium]